MCAISSSISALKKFSNSAWWQSLQVGRGGDYRALPRIIGARASFATCIAASADSCCAPGKHSLYHSGDTAYFNGFREIGERLHPELALLPIGAYDPPSFRAVHTSPEDAVQAFRDLGARWMIPMHYGTFKLSHEPIDEPVKRLRADAERLGISG